MKKLLALSILFSLLVFSCEKEPEPEPEVIRAYCNLHHFIPDLESVVWEIDGVELPDEQPYSELFPGSVILDDVAEEIEFILKQPGTSEELISQQLQLEQDTYYNVIVTGSAADPTLLFEEINTSQPQAGKVKFQILHAIPGQGPIDLYMGDTTVDNRLVTALDSFELSEAFEAFDFDARASISATAHSDSYQPDSVLLLSEYNDLIVSGASYLMVVSPYTFDSSSKLTFWLYGLPLE